MCCDPVEEVISLPTHTASNPYPADQPTAETHHQRCDQACPGENVALDIKQTHHQRVDRACPGENVASDIKDVDKNDMPETGALVGRSEQGVVKSGEERASLPAHTAPIPKMRVELEVKLYTAYATRDTPGGR